MFISAPNFTQAPNILFDYWMSILSGSEFKVLCCLARKIFGWHKENYRDRISLSQIEKMTGLTRESVTIAIKSLESHNLITKIVAGSEGQQQTVYELVVSDNPNNNYQSENPTPPLVGKSDPPSRKIRPTKETTTKESNITLEASIAKPIDACAREQHQPAMPAGEKIFYQRPNKQIGSITKSEIFSHFLSKEYPTEKIIEAISIMQERKFISDPLKFIESLVVSMLFPEPKKDKEKIDRELREEMEYQKRKEENLKKPRGNFHEFQNKNTISNQRREI